jgi:hypothetical protein
MAVTTSLGSPLCRESRQSLARSVVARDHQAMEVKGATADFWSLIPASCAMTATHFGSCYHLQRQS